MEEKNFVPSVKEVESSLNRFESQNKVKPVNEFWLTVRDYPLLRFPTLDTVHKYIDTVVLPSISDGKLHVSVEELGIVNIRVESIKFDV